MISQVLGSGKLGDFEALVKVYNKPNFIAKAMLVWSKEFAKKVGKQVEKLFPTDIIETVIQAVAKGKIKEGDVQKVMAKIAEGADINKALKVEKTDLRHLESEIAKIIKEKPGLSIGAYMGLVMKAFQGRVDGKAAMQILKKLVK
jgi:Glu-tRNA(Gln) amidotransferase subunit E-like FAD-binding protein